MKIHRVQRAAGILAATLVLVSIAQPVQSQGLSSGTVQSTNYDSNTVTINTASLPDGTAGVYYNATLEASGGSGTYYWKVSGSSLPSNLSLSEGGVISGTPKIPSTYSFTIMVTDSLSHTAARTYSLVIRSLSSATVSILTTSLPACIVATRYYTTLSATGGSGIYTWDITSGSLPEGLNFSNTGVISGTPTTASTAKFTVRVVDSKLMMDSQSFLLTVSSASASASLTVKSSDLPKGVVGTFYTKALEVTGGTGNYTWSVSSGGLPDGLSLSNTGVISGTPSSACNASFTVNISDASTLSASKTYYISIVAADYTHVVISTASLPAGVSGVYYSKTLMASGGAGGYIWKITSGSPPDGLQLSKTGVMYGTPGTTGTFTFSVSVRDVNSLSADCTYSIDITSPVSTTPKSTPSDNASPPVTPATDAIAFSGLEASPTSVGPGQPITISLKAVNSGEEQASVKAVLTINDSTESTQEVSLAAGQSRTITFTVTRTTPGTYRAGAGTLNTAFTIVKQADYGWIWIAALAVLVGLAITWRLMVLRRKSRDGEI